MIKTEIKIALITFLKKEWQVLKLVLIFFKKKQICMFNFVI